MSLTGTATGHGLKLLGGATSGDGLNVTGQGTGIDIDAPDFVDLIWDEDSTGHWTSPNMAFVSGQTGASQAVIDTVNKILASVGNKSDTSITIKLGAYDGTGGDDTNVKEDIDAISAASGSGPRLCSLAAVDANDDHITDGETRMTSGATTYTADISGKGWAVYSLTDATWSGLVYATGYVQDTIPQTFEVTASMKDTLTMTAVSIPNPSAADKVTCYIDTYNIMGAVVQNATLTATVCDNGPWFAVDDSSAIMIPTKVSARTNSSGRATIELWESAEVRNALGDNPTFDFILEKSRYFKWSVEDRSTPDADNWQIK